MKWNTPHFRHATVASICKYEAPASLVVFAACPDSKVELGFFRVPKAFSWTPVAFSGTLEWDFSGTPGGFFLEPLLGALFETPRASFGTLVRFLGPVWLSLRPQRSLEMF